MRASILLVEDDRAFRMVAEAALVSEGFEVRTAGTLAQARAAVDEATPDVVILDRRLPDGDGIDFLKEQRSEGTSAPLFVVITAYGDVENAVEALRTGAWDYLVKPIQLTDLIVKLNKALQARGLKDRLAIARSGTAGIPPVTLLSPSMQEVRKTVLHLASSANTSVLLLGPSGVGKQYISEMLHRLTWCANDPDAPFVEVNCAALPDDLVESELFGHERGAFTDARTTRRGLIELANGGTLFLDEVTELPSRSQAKLLKFLDGMRFRRLGGQREIEVSLRVIAASNRDVAQLVREGRLREDLYHRLNVFCINLSALSDRREDVPILAESFTRYFAARSRKPIQGLSSGALAALQSYNYPGNVRELRNIIERAVILATTSLITERDLLLTDPVAASANPKTFFSVDLGPDGSPQPIEAIEKNYVSRVLDYFEGRRMAAAEALGLSYPTFLKRLRELGLDR